MEELRIRRHEQEKNKLSRETSILLQNSYGAANEDRMRLYNNQYHRPYSKKQTSITPAIINNYILLFS